MKKLASLRSDDLIYAGFNNSSDSTSMLNIVQSITEKYSKSYTSLSSTNEISSTNFSEHELPTINDVMYEMMNEKDKLNELSQLVSKLRFACETSNQDSIAESEQDILLLSSSISSTVRMSSCTCKRTTLDNQIFFTDRPIFKPTFQYFSNTGSISCLSR